ncbi:homeobox protein invected-like [Eupeodes corollae]|uniref:homeobox protein invected-like n=1 Tax=Eupeodes corollae TaxID=290404 RepID=UPI00248FB0E4|nr:homeobox protein invected-like [Eupeodes corollae]
MTTLATSRLLLPPPPQLLPILSAAAALSSETLAHKMHPDKLLMHAHGVTSPRLCPTGQLVKATPPPSVSSDSPLQYPPTIADDDELTGDMNDEVASVCDSEDSELSVGQENCDRSNNLISSADSGCVSRPSSANGIGNTRLTDELIDPFAMAALRIPAAVAASSVPIVRPSPTRFQEEFLRKSHIYAEELMKQQMQFMAAARASAFSLRHQSSAASAAAASEQTTENINNFSGIHSHLSAISKMTQMSQMAAQNGGESALSKLTAFGLVAQSASNSSTSSLNQLQQQMQAHLPFMNNNMHEPSLKFSIDNILKADFGRRITDPLNKLGGGGNGGAGGSSRARNSKRVDKSLSSSSATSAKVVSGVGNAVATSSSSSTTGTPIDLTSVCSNAASIAASATSSLISNHCTNSNDSTSTVFSSNYSTPVKSPTSASSATTTAASPSETAGADNSAEACGSGNASTSSGSGSGTGSNGPIVWPAWVYCTRYSDRPSSG